MRAVFIAFGRAVLSQLHIRMLLLTVLPFGLSLALWMAVLWFSWQPVLDWVNHYFAAHDGSGWLGWLGSGALKVVVVPLLAMWVLLPLMILTALAVIGVLAMPFIVRHVSERHYAQLEPRNGGNLLGSLWMTLSSFAVFALLWLLTLPLSVLLQLGFLIQPILLGWLTYRVMAYDAMSAHADRQELALLLRRHRWPLLLIGALTGVMGAAPTLVWLGGALVVALSPLLAGVAIWLYVVIFVFTGLWFQHYCMEALAQHRQHTTAAVVTLAANSMDRI